MPDEEKKGIVQRWKEKQIEQKKKKLIEKIKKKDAQMNKTKEEIKKMALELKDGKLVKKDDNEKNEQVQPHMQQPRMMEMPQRQPQPQPQYQQMQQPNPFDNAIQQNIPRQEFVNQPTGPQSTNHEENAMEDVPINFVLVGGLSFQFIVKLGNLQQVLTYIAESINNQEVIELGSRLLNPRQIIFYEY